jgi:hypothetical protein
VATSVGDVLDPQVLGRLVASSPRSSNHSITPAEQWAAL